ncbi:MAG: D-aminoacylase [Alphaproteobacteria bacterium]|nr:D-aminoacylase [Alphaproteobacteria bacterium]
MLIRGATVIDGTGSARIRTDVRITDGRIAEIGQLSREDHTIDADGLVLAPGFIDCHTHDDEAVLADRTLACKTSQGVTTVVTGNCGISLAPMRHCPEPAPPPLDLFGRAGRYRFAQFRDYAAALAATPPAVHVAALVGHMTLRVEAMDRTDRPANEREIAHMAARLDEALAEGALGLSTGLAYKPNQAAPTAEVIALAQVVARYHGVYTTHMRDEGAAILASIEETAEVGRAAGVAAIISHHKLAGRPHFGGSTASLPLIEQLAARQPLGFDMYPYPASSTVLEAHRVAMAERTIVTWSDPHPDCAGEDLAVIAARWGVTVEAAVTRLVPAGAIYFSMDEGDVRAILSHRLAMVGSDGLWMPTGRPHPRLWGTFPRVLGHYVRDVGLFDLETAVHRMTGLTAERFGLKDRGRIAVGAAADLVLFDPTTIRDRATFDSPEEPAEGIHTVFVHGTPVWRDDRPTGATPGTLLDRRTQSRPMGTWRPQDHAPQF